MEPIKNPFVYIDREVLKFIIKYYLPRLHLQVDLILPINEILQL